MGQVLRWGGGGKEGKMEWNGRNGMEWNERKRNEQWNIGMEGQWPNQERKPESEQDY